MTPGKIPSNYIEVTASEFNSILESLEAHRKIQFTYFMQYFISRTEDTFAFVDLNNRIFVHPALLNEEEE